MAQITTVALPASSVKNFIGNFGYVYGSFQTSDLAATVTNADRIKLCSLPANCKIIGASLRLTGTSGVTALAALQTSEPTGNVIFLSATTLTPSVAIAVVMTQPHSPITSTTTTRDLEIVCATGSLSATNGGVWYWEADFARYP